MNAPDTQSSSAFTDSQFRSIYPDGIEDHYWTLARHGILARHLSRVATSEDLLVDVGCGRGQFVHFLRARGLRCIGSDVSDPEPINGTVSESLFLRTDVRALPRVLQEQARVLLFLDVLEHLREPAALLRECLQLFPKCEYIVITVPARRELWSNYDEFNGHYARYDPSCMGKLYDGVPCDLDYARYFFHVLYLPAFILARLGVNRSTTWKAPRRRTRWLHRLLSWGFVQEERLLPHRWPGTSLLIVLRRHPR